MEKGAQESVHAERLVLLEYAAARKHDLTPPFVEPRGRRPRVMRAHVPVAHLALIQQRHRFEHRWQGLSHQLGVSQHPTGKAPIGGAGEYN